MNIHVLNRKHELLTVIHNDEELGGVLDFNLIEDLAELDTLDFEVSGNADGIEHLLEGNYIMTQNLAGKWKLFVITRVKDSHGVGVSKLIECEECISELGDEDNLVEYMGTSIDLPTVIAALLSNTTYTSGVIETPLLPPQLDKSTKYTSVLSVIKQLAAAAGLNLFLDITVDDTNRITKTLSLKETNKEEGKRFEFDSDLGSIERTVDASTIKTAIRPLGAAIEQTQEEVNAGKPIEYITIKDVVWYTSEGKPLDKPAGQELLIDPVATEKYGVLGSDGSMKPKIIVMQFEDISDPELLAVKAWAELEKLVKPQVNYAFTATDLTQHMSKLGEGEHPVEVGDVCYAIDDSVQPPIVTEVVIRRIEGNPDQKDSMKVEIGIPETTLVDGGIGGGTVGVGGSGGSGGGGISTEELTAIKASINELKANKAEITDLTATNITVSNLAAEVAKIELLEADMANINEALIGKADIANLNAVDAKITQLKAEVAYIGDLEAANAKIDNLTANKANISDLNATNANVSNLTAEVAKIGQLEADLIDVEKLVAGKADIGDLTAANAKIDSLEANKASIGQLDAANANIETLLAHKATIETLVAGNITAANIKAGTITADSAIVASLNASKITTGTLDASKITVTNLNAGSITAGTIDASKINVTNINASNINTGTLDASKVTVTNMNAGSITGGTIDAAKVTVLNLNASNIKTGTLDASTISVTNLNATNITTGNLDCNRVTIKNLKADSIVAGSITVQGDNLIRNTSWKDSTLNWGLRTGWSRDTSVLFEGENSMKFSYNAATSNVWLALTSERVLCGYGDTFVLSGYFKCDDLSTINTSGMSLMCDIYNAPVGGTRINSPYVNAVYTAAEQGTWVRAVLTVTITQTDAKSIVLRTHVVQNGQYWFAKPMVSRGTIASVWKPHTDELISDGAIGNDQLGGESVTSDKLVLDEIFASSAFITKFEAVEIKAQQITTGKISSQFLDIEGIISFAKNPDAFGDDMVDNFIFDTTADKTFINGGAIYANSVTAEKINAKGLKITNAGNETTFQVFDAAAAAESNGKYQEGDVVITGAMESTNYDPASNTGYRIDKDGNVDIFNANIRGDVILPQAGITNFGEQTGNENLVLTSDAYITLPTANKMFTHDVDRIKALRGKQVTVSFEVDAAEVLSSSASSGSKRFGYEPSIKFADGTTQYISVWVNVSTTTPYTNSGRIYATHTINDKEIVSMGQTGIYLQGITSGSITIGRPKFEIGDKATPWCPHKDDATALNPVRFWAGADFAKRDEAPFQVLQDGTVRATRGEFGGTFTGELSVGNIRIADTNASEASFTIHSDNFAKKVLDFNEKHALITTALVLGDELTPSLQFDPTSRAFNFKSSAVHISGNKSKVSFPADTTGSLLKAGYTGNYGYAECHTYIYGGTYVQEHNGTINESAKVPDFEFKRAQGDTSVKVRGSVDVDNEVVIGSVKIVNRSKDGKKRIDFVVV